MAVFTECWFHEEVFQAVSDRFTKVEVAASLWIVRLPC